MPNKHETNTLSGLGVGEAMRRQVIRLSQHAALSSGITALIKYKVNALLTTDDEDRPTGVVSKTDVMGAYYAELPIDTPLEHIMSAPPLFCRSDASLEDALETMRAKSIYRLYVTDIETGQVIGALAYPDIVGLLYRYCHTCAYSRFGQKKRQQPGDSIRRLTVRDVMTPQVRTLGSDAPLSHVMESLSAYRFGAMLMVDSKGTPCGVISKTDLALAYKHQKDPEAPAQSIMTAPVLACSENKLLEDAIQQMIFTDIHRIFVHGETAEQIVGVLSLTDAARRRSGSCHACVSSRITVDAHN